MPLFRRLLICIFKELSVQSGVSGRIRSGLILESRRRFPLSFAFKNGSHFGIRVYSSYGFRGYSLYDKQESINPFKRER